MEIALEQMPHMYHALNVLGNIYRREGNNEKAEEYFKRSREILPGQ